MQIAEIDVRGIAWGAHLYIGIFNSFVSRERQQPVVRRGKTRSKIGKNPRDKSRILSRGDAPRRVRFGSSMRTDHVSLPYHAPFHSATVPFGLIPRVSLSPFFPLTKWLPTRGPFRALNHSDFRRACCTAGTRSLSSRCVSLAIN